MELHPMFGVIINAPWQVYRRLMIRSRQVFTFDEKQKDQNEVLVPFFIVTKTTSYKATIQTSATQTGGTLLNSLHEQAIRISDWACPVTYSSLILDLWHHQGDGSTPKGSRRCVYSSSPHRTTTGQCRSCGWVKWPCHCQGYASSWHSVSHSRIFGVETCTFSRDNKNQGKLHPWV